MLNQAGLNAAVERVLTEHFSRPEYVAQLEKAVRDGVARGVAAYQARSGIPAPTRLSTLGPDRPLAAVAGSESLAKAAGGNPRMDKIEADLAKAAESLAATNASLGLTAPAPAPASPPAPAGERLIVETPAECLARYDAIRANGDYVPEAMYDRVRWATEVGPLFAAAEPRDVLAELAGVRAPYVDGRADAAVELKAARDEGNPYRIAHAERAASAADMRHAQRPAAANLPH